MFRRGTEVPGFKLKSSADKIWIFSSIFPNQSMDEIGLNQREKNTTWSYLFRRLLRLWFSLMMCSNTSDDQEWIRFGGDFRRGIRFCERSQSGFWQFAPAELARIRWSLEFFLLHANLLIRRWKTSSPVAGMWNFVDTGSGLEIRNHLKLTLQLALHFQLRAGGKSFECMRIFFFNGGFKF